MTLAAFQQLEMSLAQHVDALDSLVLLEEINDVVLFLFPRNRESNPYFLYLRELHLDVGEHGCETLQVMTHVQDNFLGTLGYALETAWLTLVTDIVQDLGL